MSKPLRALVVEDSEDDTELLLRALRGNGYAPTHTRVDTPDVPSETTSEFTADNDKIDQMVIGFPRAGT